MELTTSAPEEFTPLPEHLIALTDNGVRYRYNRADFFTQHRHNYNGTERMGVFNSSYEKSRRGGAWALVRTEGGGRTQERKQAADDGITQADQCQGSAAMIIIMVSLQGGGYSQGGSARYFR